MQPSLAVEPLGESGGLLRELEPPAQRIGVFGHECLRRVVGRDEHWRAADPSPDVEQELDRLRTGSPVEVPFEDLPEIAGARGRGPRVVVYRVHGYAEAPEGPHRGDAAVVIELEHEDGARRVHLGTGRSSPSTNSKTASTSST